MEFLDNGIGLVLGNDVFTLRKNEIFFERRSLSLMD